MLRNIFWLLVAFATFSSPADADTLKVMAAGSLSATLTELLQRFPLQSEEGQAILRSNGFEPVALVAKPPSE